MAVKDLFRLKGLKTSLNNKSYYEVSSPSDSTAAVLASLVHDGAHIVGLTKLSSMVAREEPMDAVDFHTAVNPRADGYQSPAGSSSGSAAAVAAYDWLDCAIGTDTSGSGRRPAMVNGVWQFRPTHDLVDQRGMVTTYSAFDTPVLFARELRHMRSLLGSWITGPEPASQPTKPFEILYLLEYLPVSNKPQMELINSFITDACTHLGASITKLSIRSAWKASHPPGTPDDVDEYLHNLITETYYFEYFHSTSAFRAQYAQSHDGQPPYVIPFVQRRWAKGAAVSPAQNRLAREKLDTYKHWLHETLFLRHNRTTLIVLPVAEAAPNYRDTASPSPEDQSALDELFLPPILGAPDLVVSIGDVPYWSRVTEREEFLPVVVDVMGAPGTDFALLDAVKRVLVRAGRPTVVCTGSRIFAAQ